jgi:acetyl-CoA C-acetyltransferase
MPSATAATDPVVIVAARRTPVGGFQGALAACTAPQLGAVALRAALAQSGLPAGAVAEVLVGCVLPAGLGQAPARQAALGAGVPDTVPCTTVNKMCGSGMKALMLAHDQLLAGDPDDGAAVAAGGMESMSRAPYLLPQARAGMRLGHGQVLDHMFHDGLQSPFDGRLMGCFAEDCAARYGFDRAAQDAFAAESVRRARQAVADGAFRDEIAPVDLPPSSARRGADPARVDTDETPMQCDPDKIPTLKPAFRTDGLGTVTAANSSSISDGAAMLVLMRASAARARGIRPLATLVGHATHAQAPEWFTTAPAGAIDRLQRRLGWTPDTVDLYEINEAFAVVPMAAMRELGLPHGKVNVHGGACALGHPIGASGARIVVTLLHALRRHGLRRGIASLCLGGGEATAVAVERAD